MSEPHAELLAARMRATAAAVGGRARLLQDPDTGEQRWMLNGEEWDLIGLVCDQIDRANPDLPIEVCQAIARDIIQLVRART